MFCGRRQHVSTTQTLFLQEYTDIRAGYEGNGNGVHLLGAVEAAEDGAVATGPRLPCLSTPSSTYRHQHLINFDRYMIQLHLIIKNLIFAKFLFSPMPQEPHSRTAGAARLPHTAGPTVPQAHQLYYNLPTNYLTPPSAAPDGGV